MPPDPPGSDGEGRDGGASSSGGGAQRPPREHGGRECSQHSWFGTALAQRLDSVPLSTKLVVCTLVMLVLGMLCVTLSIRQLVSNYLLQKTDTQLVDQAQLIYDNIDSLRNRDASQEAVGPNDYYMQIRDTRNVIVSTPLSPTLKDGVVSEPVLPPVGSMQGVVPGTAFTTQARVRGVSQADPDTLQAARAPWRVLALQWGQKDGDDITDIRGVVYIALSLSDQIDTVRTLTKYSVMTSLAIVILGGVIAALIVQRTLVPLKRIEKTAAKIAAGELGCRVPEAPVNTEVGSLAASLNSMLSRIERSFLEQEESTEKMKRFVSDASHELRTPLAAIHGYAELYAMQRDLPGAVERADESIAHIESSSTRMTELVEDLLSLARLDEGRGIDITQQVRLTPLLSDAIDDLHALDPERGIHQGTLSVHPAQEGAPTGLRFEPGVLPDVALTADGSRLRQVVTNIVGNIHRYTPPDSPVEVSLGTLSSSIVPETLSRMPSTEGSLRGFLESVPVSHTSEGGRDYAVLRFSDHGPGVPPEAQSRIFERFYTADRSRARKKGGTGLGMAIVQSVVKAHHGLICATTSEGGGLTLTVVLPMAPTGPKATHADGDRGSPSGHDRVKDAAVVGRSVRRKRRDGESGPRDS